jgi:hypothetical protein
MKAKYYVLLSALMLSASLVKAQNADGREFRDDDKGTVINNYFPDNDYYYSSRIRRFHNSYTAFEYYSPIFTDANWYNYQPFRWGISIYGGGAPLFGYSYNNPFIGFGLNFGYYDGYYDPYAGNYYYGGYAPVYYNSWFPFNINIGFNLSFGNFWPRNHYDWCNNYYGHNDYYGRNDYFGHSDFNGHNDSYRRNNYYSLNENRPANRSNNSYNSYNNNSRRNSPAENLEGKRNEPGSSAGRKMSSPGSSERNSMNRSYSSVPASDRRSQPMMQENRNVSRSSESVNMKNSDYKRNTERSVNQAGNISRRYVQSAPAGREAPVRSEPAIQSARRSPDNSFSRSSAPVMRSRTERSSTAMRQAPQPAQRKGASPAADRRGSSKYASSSNGRHEGRR